MDPDNRSPCPPHLRGLACSSTSTTDSADSGGDTEDGFVLFVMMSVAPLQRMVTFPSDCANLSTRDWCVGMFFEASGCVGRPYSISSISSSCSNGVCTV
jgi:hypothetical protein